MPARPSPAARTTLYRLINVVSLKDGISKLDKRAGFSIDELTIEGRDALLVRGILGATGDNVRWAGQVQELTGRTVELTNSTAAGVLLVRPRATGTAPEDADAARALDEVEDEAEDKSVAWALTWGMGFHLLASAKFDNGFGQRVAVRTADPAELNSLTKSTIGQRTRIEKASIPEGDDLYGFGAGDLGEMVTRLVAKAEIPGLTAGDKPIGLRGADSLSLPLGRKPEDLVKDLDILGRVLRQKAKPELELLEQLVAVKDPEVIEHLEGELATAISGGDLTRLGLSWPHELSDETRPITHYKLMNARGGRGLKPGLPDCQVLVEPVAGLGAAQQVDRLKRIRVALFSDNDEGAIEGPALPAYQWLNFEVPDEGRRYCLHNGRWYLMNQDYAERVHTRVREIFARDPGFVLPVWPAGHDEAEYNELVADKLQGLCLDVKLVRGDLHRRGIEVCDVLIPDGTPLHIKNLSSSKPASHLLAQALVSTEMLLQDQVGQNNFRERVAALGWDPARLPDKPAKVALGVAKRGSVVTADDLFTFTQVTLARQTQILDERNVRVVIAPIERPA